MTRASSKSIIGEHESTQRALSLSPHSSTSDLIAFFLHASKIKASDERSHD
jgi:hypothetical protein